MEHDDFKSAIQSYIADDEKDISVLMDYARLRKVVKKKCRVSWEYGCSESGF